MPWTPWLSPTTCRVPLEHAGMLGWFAAGLALAAVVSLLSGTTYCKRSISRAGEPRSFALVVTIYAALALLIAFGLIACPRG